MKKTLVLPFILTFLFLPLLVLAQETPKDFQAGMDSYHKADYPAALQHFKDAINDDPDSWQSYELEGYCYYYLGDMPDMRSAFDQSLKLHPDNPALTAYLAKLDQMPPEVVITPTTQAAIAVPAAPQSTPARDYTVTSSIGTDSGTNHWQSFDLDIPKESLSFHLYSGVDFSFMDDLINGLNNWGTYEKGFSNVITSSTNFSRFGFISGLELKRSFGNHEIALGGEIITGAGGESDVQNNNGTIGKVVMNPTVFELGLNYTYHFSPSGNLRPYLGLGAGYYWVDIQYENPVPIAPGSSPAGYYAQGDFDGSTFGGQASVGIEWAIDKCFSFDLLGRFRLATFGQLVSTNLVGSNATLGTAYALEIYNNDLFYTNQSYIGQGGRRYAVLDYSGVDLMLGLHFYFGGEPLPNGPKKVEPSANPVSSSSNTQTGGWQGHGYYAPAPTPTPNGYGYVPSYAPAGPYR